MLAFAALWARLYTLRSPGILTGYCLGVEGAVFKDTNSSVNFSLENMFRFLYEKFSRVATGATKDGDEYVRFGNWPQVDLWDRFNAVLANADPTAVHVVGDPTNEQKIQNFRFLPRDHPDVTSRLVTLQWFIDAGANDTLGNGEFADVMGFFGSDEHVRKAALAMGIHPRLGAHSLLRGLSVDTVKLIASFM